MSVDTRPLPHGGGVVAVEQNASLSDVHGTIPVPQGSGWLRQLRRLLAFAGPGYMVSVGYMDPGNWATDLAGGSRFGYALLWVILMSNLMAILLQTLSLRLGLATGMDLAQACRVRYKKPTVVALWLLCEIAIVACDIAEVIGSAIALKLLFHLPLLWGVLVTGADVLVLLALTRFGFRKLEAVIITLVATVAGCFALQTILARPAWGAVAHGLLVPTLPGTEGHPFEGLLIAVGILGATVMPHNLYLHSSLVQTRRVEQDGNNDKDAEPRLSKEGGIRQAIRYNTLETVIALGSAFFVNAAILVLAGAVFHGRGQAVETLEGAHELLVPILGSASAVAFAVALLASGQSSTITGTLAGQIVMEGFLQIRIKPWLRRIITRLLAIVPALALIGAFGDRSTDTLLIFSQVVLSMQLSFATFPLVAFTANRAMMGRFTNPLWLTVAGYGVCGLIAALNIYLLYATLQEKFGAWGIVGLVALVLCAVLFGVWVQFGYRGRKGEMVTGS